MIPGTQPKLLLTLDELTGDGKLTLDEIFKELVGPNENTNWKLVRERDDLTKYSDDVMWVEWDKDGRFTASSKFIEVGYSLIMSPFNDSFTWQTTIVTEITEKGDFHVKFKTKNSNYSLYKI
jgi:hypothetical protein